MDALTLVPRLLFDFGRKSLKYKPMNFLAESQSFCRVLNGLRLEASGTWIQPLHLEYLV